MTGNHTSAEHIPLPRVVAEPSPDTGGSRGASSARHRALLGSFESALQPAQAQPRVPPFLLTDTKRPELKPRTIQLALNRHRTGTVHFTLKHTLQDNKQVATEGNTLHGRSYICQLLLYILWGDFHFLNINYNLHRWSATEPSCTAEQTRLRKLPMISIYK